MRINHSASASSSPSAPPLAAAKTEIYQIITANQAIPPKVSGALVGAAPAHIGQAKIAVKIYPVVTTPGIASPKTRKIATNPW